MEQATAEYKHDERLSTQQPQDTQWKTEVLLFLRDGGARGTTHEEKIEEKKLIKHKKRKLTEGKSCISELQDFKFSGGEFPSGNPLQVRDGPLEK